MKDDHGIIVENTIITDRLATRVPIPSYWRGAGAALSLAEGRIRDVFDPCHHWAGPLQIWPLGSPRCATTPNYVLYLLLPNAMNCRLALISFKTFVINSGEVCRKSSLNSYYKVYHELWVLNVHNNNFHKSFHVALLQSAKSGTIKCPELWILQLV